MKFRRNDKVLPIKAIQSSIKINGESVTVNPLLLFQRMTLSINNPGDTNNYLKFELAPYPLSNFNEYGMRKNKKDDLYEEFTRIKALRSTNNILHLADGGFLIHKVVWQKDDTIEKILNKYLQYVRSHYAVNSYIIFDGYPEMNSTPVILSATLTGTKVSERSRRQAIHNIPTFSYKNNTKIPFEPAKFFSDQK